jgi:hypothetical protein
VQDLFNIANNNKYKYYYPDEKSITDGMTRALKYFKPDTTVDEDPPTKDEL